MRSFTPLLFVCLLVCIGFQAHAKDPQSLSARRITEKPVIDGKLDESIWQADNTFYTGNFTQNEPNNGDASEQRTDIYLVYDDFAVYIAAKMYDKPDSSLKEFGIRDSGERNSDMFAVGFDTYNKQQNAFFFMVSAAGVQTDMFITPNNEDVNWNAVLEK